MAGRKFHYSEQHRRNTGAWQFSRHNHDTGDNTMAISYPCTGEIYRPLPVTSYRNMPVLVHRVNFLSVLFFICINEFAPGTLAPYSRLLCLFVGSWLYQHFRSPGNRSFRGCRRKADGVADDAGGGDLISCRLQGDCTRRRRDRMAPYENLSGQTRLARSRPTGHALKNHPGRQLSSTCAR